MKAEVFLAGEAKSGRGKHEYFFCSTVITADPDMMLTINFHYFMFKFI